jgi:hypothetical protein
MAGMFDGSRTTKQDTPEASVPNTAVPTPIPEWNQKGGIPIPGGK